MFAWTSDCADAFATLKSHLVQAPVLSYPCFDRAANEFSLQTDASAVGIGAVLEQGGHVIAYASRSLTAPERQYSVIQRECLAVVYALKQFRHYLLGRHFQLLTDHAPLRWLSSKRWRECYVVGHWPCKSTTLKLYTTGDLSTPTQIDSPIKSHHVPPL